MASKLILVRHGQSKWNLKNLFTQFITWIGGTISGPIVSFFKKNGFSRLPVFSEDLDNIIGLLYVKDLLGYFFIK